MLVSPAIHGLVLGPWKDADEEIRWSRLRADLDSFVEGRLIVVGRNGYMKLLDPRREEVWEIRSRSPKPSLRLFGRFAARDVFVALTWSARAPLAGKGSLPWRDAIRACKAEWRKLFPTYQPLSGSDIHDYIADEVIEV